MPATPDPATVALRFNDCITARDLDALCTLMTDDHTFIDTTGQATAGREACRAAWRGFFVAFPDYRNHLATVSTDGARVTMSGSSTCAVPALAGPALWTATIRRDRVAQWRVYDDTPDNRSLLGLTTA